MSSPETDVSVTQIFEFKSHFIENIHLRSNGHLLLSSIHSGDLFEIDPSSPNPTAKSIVSCPGSTGLTGIATIGPNLYAVSGGIHSPFRLDDMSVYIISIPEDSETGTLIDRIPIPDTYGLNGMASVPANPHIVLCADSHGSCIHRINTQTREIDIPISDPLLGYGPTFNLGINGIKTFKDYVYFTNSGQGHFSRIKIHDDGSPDGDVEVIAKIPGEDPGMGHAYDDFAMDGEGNAYVACHLNQLMKIDKEGVQTLFVGGGKSGLLQGPTCAAVAGDGKGVWVGTAGMVFGGDPTKEMVFNGQVMKIEL